MPDNFDPFLWTIIFKLQHFITWHFLLNQNYDFISSVIFNISVLFKTLDFWKQHFVFWKFLYSLNQVNVNHLRIYIKCQLKRTTQITSTFYLLRTFTRLFGLYPFSQHDFKRSLSGSNLTQIDIYIGAKNSM